MDFEAQRELQPELGRSERLLWAGRPATGLLFRPIDILLIPLSLVWGGFAIFWEAMVIVAGAPIFAVLWGVPFVLVGLYLIFGRFIHDAWARARTRYGISNNRILIRDGGFARRLISIDLSSVNEVWFDEKADRTGTIHFRSPSLRLVFYPGGRWPSLDPRQNHVFEAVQDMRGVYEIMRKAQQDRSEKRRSGAR